MTSFFEAGSLSASLKQSQGVSKGKSGRKKLSSNERAWKMQKMSHHWCQCVKWFSRCPISKSGVWARWTSPFIRFSAKYDITDAILQDNEEIKVQYLKSLLFHLFEFCRLLELNKGISLDFKFCCYGNWNKNNKPLFKNKRLLFSHNKKSVAPIFLPKIMSPAA